MSLRDSIIATLIFGFVTSPFVFRFLKWLKSGQNVSSHAPETHKVKQGTPNMGGLMILSTLLFGIAISWQQGAQLNFLMTRERNEFVVPVILLLGFGIIGFLDDYLVPKMKPGSRGISWVPKLVLQTLVAGAAAFLEFGGDKPGTVALLTFALLFFVNAFNFSDGLDGLAGGLAIILCVGLLLTNKTAYFPLLVIASILPFMAWNAPPAKVFMGDTGSLPVGALLGYLIVMPFLRVQALGGFSSELLVWAFLLSGVMIAELVPVPLQIFWVKVFKRRLFPFTPIHHAFEKAGVPETRVVAYFWTAQAVLVLLAVISVGSGW